MNGKTTNNVPKIRPNNGRPSGGGKRDLSAVPRAVSSWSDIDNQLLRDCIVAVCDSGASIQLGRTSDGGANKVFVYDGDNIVKEYPRSVEDVEALLRWLVNMFTTD